MKKILISTIAFTLALTSVAVSSTAVTPEGVPETKISETSIIDILIELREVQLNEAREQKIQERFDELNEHVGRTWYVFSGSTPRGWDCSGMVLWFYSELGVELYHSATVQMHSGVIVTEPMIGDIVSISYPNSERSYHNGIYAGDGNMIHAPRPGRKTELRPIAEVSLGHTVTYTRIIFDVIN
jgi:cell wall-associated NlpC family hydrolase